MTTKIKHLLSATTVAVFCVLAIASSDDKNIESEISASAPAISISAHQLYQEYAANEVAADQKYKGQVLSVTGTVDAIAKDITDNIYVTLKGDEYIGDVQCYFADNHTNEAAQLSKGMRITVKGKCDGMMMNVLLRGCAVQ
ncbi:MAG: hypothetical protein KIS69_05765 [Bacteroidetes bacterium]|nr:hypothetical protein [Bacteroidota bacterium]